MGTLAGELRGLATPTGPGASQSLGTGTSRTRVKSQAQTHTSKPGTAVDRQQHIPKTVTRSSSWLFIPPRQMWGSSDHTVRSGQPLSFPGPPSRCHLGPRSGKKYTCLCISAGTTRAPWTQRTTSKLVGAEWGRGSLVINVPAFFDQRTTWLTAVSGADNAESRYIVPLCRKRSCRVPEHLPRPL